jgi:ribosomal protein S27E
MFVSKEELAEEITLLRASVTALEEKICLTDKILISMRNGFCVKPFICPECKRETLMYRAVVSWHCTICGKSWKEGGVLLVKD